MPARKAKASNVTTNSPCPHCGGRSQKFGSHAGKQRYFCQGECGRRFYEQYVVKDSPQCPRCGGQSKKCGRIRKGKQQYICKGPCGRRFQAYYNIKPTHPQCPRCGGRAIKRGQKRGNQKYKCNGECGREFTLTMKEARRFKARLMGEELTDAIRRAVSDLPPDLREEIMQEMAVAALDGELGLSDIRNAVPFYRRKVMRQVSNRFKFISIDQPNKDGLFYADLLAG